MNALLKNLLGVAVLVIIIIGLAQSFGWAALFWPLGIIVGGVALLVAINGKHWWSLNQLHKERTLRLRISELEAQQGLPLPTDGLCEACHEPLLVDAKFCSYCHTPTSRENRVCATCGARNAVNARWCGACGASVLPSESLYPSSSGQSIAEPL